MTDRKYERKIQSSILSLVSFLMWICCSSPRFTHQVLYVLILIIPLLSTEFPTWKMKKFIFRRILSCRKILKFCEFEMRIVVTLLVFEVFFQVSQNFWLFEFSCFLPTRNSLKTLSDVFSYFQRVLWAEICLDFRNS